MYVKEILRRKEAKELGLEDLAVGPGIRLSTPTAPDRGQGQAGSGVAANSLTGGAVQVAVSLASWARDVVGKKQGYNGERASARHGDDVVPVNAEPAAEVGLELYRSARKPLVFYVRSRKRISAIHRGPAAFVERVSENGLWVDTARHTGPLVIMQPDQTGIVLRRTSVESTDVEDSTQEQASPLQQSDVWIGLVFLRPLALPVQAEIRSNVEEWVKEYLDRTGDEWLFDLVRDRLLRADTLDHVVAIGIMARLQRPPSGQELKNALDAMLRGESVGPGQREQQWARQLNREELRSVERLAVAEAELLDEELESLGSSALVDEPEWQADMLDVLHLRDDLEGVWLLLRSGGGGDVLEGLLESIDEQGRLCIKALPIWQGPESDQRLQRAAVVNPEGWWTWPTDWDL